MSSILNKSLTLRNVNFICTGVSVIYKLNGENLIISHYSTSIHIFFGKIKFISSYDENN